MLYRACQQTVSQHGFLQCEISLGNASQGGRHVVISMSGMQHQLLHWTPYRSSPAYIYLLPLAPEAALVLAAAPASSSGNCPTAAERDFCATRGKRQQETKPHEWMQDIKHYYTVL